jgi:hypothetical protein
VRGGIAAVGVGPGGQTNVGLIFGKGLTVSGKGDTVTVTRPGFGTTIGPSGTPTSPGPFSSTLLNAISALNPTGSGTARKPTDAIVTASGVGAANSGNLRTSTSDAERAGGGSRRPDGTDIGNLNYALNLSTVAAGAGASFLIATGETFAFTLGRDPTLNSQIPFIRAVTVSHDLSDIPGAVVSSFLFRTAAAGPTAIP